MENHLLDRLSEFKETEPDHSIYKIPNGKYFIPNRMSYNTFLIKFKCVESKPPSTICLHLHLPSLSLY